MAPSHQAQPANTANDAPIPAPKSSAKRPHSTIVISQWRDLARYIQKQDSIVIDGSSLDIAATTAVGRYGIAGALSTDTVILDRINRSVQFLNKHMAQGHTVYGK